MDNQNFPTFTPPDAPTFTPPTPTFTPPSPSQRSGAACHFHQNEPAVTRCARCGKPICEDCADTYQVNDEEYDGCALCYNCCKDIVAANVKQLKKQRVKIVAMYIITLIGMILGACLGSTAQDSTWWSILIFAFVGGCAWSFFVNCLKIIVNTIRNFANGAWLGGILWFFIDMIKAIFIAVWGTMQKLFYYTKHLISTSGFIKSDSAALQQMDEYMEYTQIRSQNQGVDLADLMSQDSRLYNNSYAQNVMANGEAQAEAALRNCVTTINENGEIIRSFQG